MVIAPSGDQTDDPAKVSLYLADNRPAGGQILEFSMTQPAPVTAAAVSFTSSLIHTTNMGAFSPPSPDPDGLAYLPASNTLIMTDSEVEEIVNGITNFDGADVWEMTLSGSVVRSANISPVSPTVVPMSDEPTGVAYNSANGHYYISDDNAGAVWNLNPGADGLIGTADDSWTSFSTLGAGSSDPEGITYDSLHNTLFVIDGDNREVYQFSVTGTALGHFDVDKLGVVDPESGDFNADSGTLFILSNSGNRVIVETSLDGTLLQTIDVSASNSTAPAGLVYAPASDGSAAKHFYIVDRGIDNNDNPSIIDGKMYEMSAPAITPPARTTTTTTVTSDLPDASVVGQSVTINYSVAVPPPGSGTPTGAVTVSAGTQGCTGTVAAGSCTIAFVTAGAKTINATYAGDTLFSGSVSTPGTAHTVNPANTTATITYDSPDPSVVGQSVGIDYTIAVSAPGSGKPTGTVTVSDGTQSCTGTARGGGCSIIFTTPGAKTLTATYAGDANFNGSGSVSGVAHAVNKASTTTTITSDLPDPSVAGQSVTINYSVAVTAPGHGTPTGNVTISDGLLSCTGSAAAGSCSITFTSPGTKNLTASYAGDTSFIGSASTPATAHNVTKADTTTAITSDLPDPSVVDQAYTVNYSVAVTSPGGGTPTGNVTVSDGTDSCSGTVAAGSCSLTSTSTGVKKLSAAYAGDANFNTSSSANENHTVHGIATTTVITNAAALATATVVGQSYPVTFSVTPASGGNPSGNVTVSDGAATCIGTVASGTCSLTSTTAGIKSLTASYEGANKFDGSTSSAVPHTVNAAATTTVITSDPPDPSTVGQSVTVNYSVSVNAPGSGTPSGNVTVSVSGSADSCTGSVAGGSCTLAFSTAGAKSLTATYIGNANFSGSSSSPATDHTVNKANTTTTIISDSPDPSLVGQAVTINYSVAVTSPGSGTPSGNVTVSVSGSADSCTGSVAAGSCSIAFTSVGAKTLTASYAGDANFNTSSSASAGHAVRAATSTAITSDLPDQSTVGQTVSINYSVSVTSPGGGTPTGNVTVSAGTDNCSGTVAAGSCSISFTTAGAKNLTATYAGDTNFITSVSASESHTVNAAGTTTAISTDLPDPSVVGQSVTVNYSVSVNAPGSGTPTGNVTVSAGTDNCTGTVAAGSCSIAFTTPGAKSLTASYAGNTNFSGSSSTPGTAHTVNQASTTTTITSDLPDPSVVGQAITFNYSVAVTSPGSGTPTGNVTVSGGSDSCTGTAAAGSCSIIFTNPGLKTLTASYAGDTNFITSSSTTENHTVKPAGTTTVITSDLSEPSVVGQTATIQYNVTVNVPGSGTPTGTVMVSDGTQTCSGIGSVAAGSCSITFSTAGVKTFTATYIGNANFSGSSSSPAIAHTVNQATTTTIITSDSPDPSTVGQAVTIHYNVVVSSPGSGTPTGNVTVSDGTQSCTGSVAAGSCSIVFPEVGGKTLTATYEGDLNFTGSTSATESHAVRAATSIVITSDLPDPSLVGQTVTIHYSVTVPPPGSGTPTGTVTVSDGTQSCAGSVAEGSCSITFTSPGIKTLSATYSGDETYIGSASAGIQHTVIIRIYLPLLHR